MINAIVDLYHQNSIDMVEAVNAGLVALIHKATEGTHFKDGRYKERREQAKDLGLLWGSYHFASGELSTDQVDAYLEFTDPEPSEFVCLDWEPSTSGRDMDHYQANNFVESVRKAIHRYPLIYGGALLRENTTPEDASLSQCPLWYARYGPRALGIPCNWSTWTLWQYTDGNVGPKPHSFHGIGYCDRSYYNGTVDELKHAWPLTRAISPLPIPLPIPLP